MAAYSNAPRVASSGRPQSMSRRSPRYGARIAPFLVGLCLCLSEYSLLAVEGQSSTVTVSGGDGAGDYCTWTRHSPAEEAPPARYGHTLTLAKATETRPAKMILFGGFDGAFRNNYMNDMWMWDISQYMTVGGDDQLDGGVTQTSEKIGDKFDAGKWRIVKQTGLRPGGRYGHSSTTVTGTEAMVVFGGNSGQADLLYDLWIFDLRLQLWTEILPPASAVAELEQHTVNSSWPAARAYASMTDVEGSVYMFGGWSSSTGALAELWHLDLGQDASTGTLIAEPQWTRLLDSCSNDLAQPAVPERCAPTHEAQCAAVDAGFHECTQWNEPFSSSFPDGLSGRALCDGGPNPFCAAFLPNASQSAAGCVGRAMICAQAGECTYSAPNRTADACVCSGVLQCAQLDSQMHSNWGLAPSQVSGECLLLSGPDVSNSRFVALDVDNSGYLESGEVPDLLILQLDTGGAGFNGELRDNKISTDEYFDTSTDLAPSCTPDYAAVCAAVVNDGTAATCEGAGHCTYIPAQPARHCDPGPRARFSHAAVTVSIDLLVFGGYTGTEYLSDLWRYDTATLQWSQIVGIDESQDLPLGRAHTMGVPMAGGLLLWSGYTNQCANDNHGSCEHGDSPEELLSDLWHFANPAGNAVLTTTATIVTLTQKIDVTQRQITVEDAQPVWTQFNAYSGGTVGDAGPDSEIQDNSLTDGQRPFPELPQPRRFSSAVPLEMRFGLVMFGGETADGLRADTWILECTGVSKLWIVLLLLGVLCVVAAGAVFHRWFKKYRRQRATLRRVTDLLGNIAATGGLNRNGIQAEKIAPLGIPPESGFQVESGRLTPPKLLEYDAAHLKLSKGFNQKKPMISAKTRWGKLSTKFKSIGALGGLKSK